MMKHLATTTAALFLLASPGLALAQSDTSSDAATAQDKSQCSDETPTSSYDSFSAKCRGQIDAWAMSQSGASAKFEGDVAVGAVLPDTVEIIDVPAHKNYGYVMLNDHRVLVDRGTRKVVRVY